MRPLTDADRSIQRPTYDPTGKLDIPGAGIFDTPRYCLEINQEWLPILLGAVMALNEPDCWHGTPEEIEEARNEIRKIWDVEPCEEEPE